MTSDLCIRRPCVGSDYDLNKAGYPWAIRCLSASSNFERTYPDHDHDQPKKLEDSSARRCVAPPGNAPIRNQYLRVYKCKQTKNKRPSV